ncbi:sugar ABC transporter permease [Candidatus Aerophobetes bacterium]|uniref:Sugar ABC transporter permease n=1 Tax=Aerophobetes bacterium TaxID=2030807 RepID=A0A523RSM8_UNCAE|nr:MAG: sugar ABC transporter permease [Candidatus Aerophobetes bacterium]
MLSLKSKKAISFLFVLPTMGVLFFTTIFPFAYTFGLSFFRWTYQLAGRPFVGVQNYMQVFFDERYLSALRTTLIILSSALSLEFILGFVLALIFVEEFKAKNVILTILVLPIMMLPIVVGFTWKLLFNNQYGPINQILRYFLGEKTHILWVAKTKTAFLSIIIADVWEWTPFVFLVLLAGLTSLPSEVYESAAIDGASAWAQFKYITLPSMRPIIAIVLLFRGLECFRIFDIVVALTRGAPGTTTETISLYLYRIGFQHFRLGYGAAANIILLIIVVVILGLLVKSLRLE